MSCSNIYRSSEKNNSENEVERYCCPRLRQVEVEPGHTDYIICCRRTCTSVYCREKWSNKEYHLLMYCHRRDPFTHRMRITPPRELCERDKVVWTRKFLDQVEKWVKRHPGEVFDLAAFPDKHGRQPLHYNAVMRASSGTVSTLRRLMQRRKAKTECSYSIAPLQDPKEQIGYAVGRYNQHLMRIVSIPKCRVLLTRGTPYFMTKKRLWKRIKNGWRLGPSCGIIKK